MKLTECNSDWRHCFKDEQGLAQSEFKSWYSNGQQWVIGHYRDDELHGEFKYWATTGRLIAHTFIIDGDEIFDFLKCPELYPTTPEEKTMFVLNYGSAPFIREGEDE